MAIHHVRFLSARRCARMLFVTCCLHFWVSPCVTMVYTRVQTCSLSVFRVCVFICVSVSVCVYGWCTQSAVCLFVCLSLCVYRMVYTKCSASVCLCLSLCLYVCLCVYLCVCLSVCLSVCVQDGVHRVQCVSLSVCLTMCLSVCVCVYRMVYTECSASVCPCVDKCSNQRIQRHQSTVQFDKFLTHNRGYGVRTANAIHSGIMSYIISPIYSAPITKRT